MKAFDSNNEETNHTISFFLEKKGTGDENRAYDFSILC